MGPLVRPEVLPFHHDSEPLCSVLEKTPPPAADIEDAQDGLYSRRGILPHSFVRRFHPVRLPRRLLFWYTGIVVGIVTLANSGNIAVSPLHDSATQTAPFPFCRPAVPPSIVLLKSTHVGKFVPPALFLVF